MFKKSRVDEANGYLYDLSVGLKVRRKMKDQTTDECDIYLSNFSKLLDKKLGVKLLSTPLGKYTWFSSKAGDAIHRAVDKHIPPPSTIYEYLISHKLDEALFLNPTKTEGAIYNDRH